MLRIFSIVLALFASSLNADVTIHYKTEIKNSLQAMMQQSVPLLSMIPADTTLRIKGNKSYSESGGEGFIGDTSGKEIILLDTAGKKYATTTVDEYFHAMAAAIPTMPDAAKAMLAAFNPKVESKLTGRTATIQGIEAEEREIVLSMERSALPNLPPGPMIRMVMQIWYSKESEATRVPAIREWVAYTQSALSNLNPTGGIKKLTEMIPLVGDSMAPVMQDLVKPNSVRLRTHIDLFMPSLAALLKQMPAGTTSPFGADFDLNGPLVQMNWEVVDFSTAAVPDSQFQAPEQYQQESIDEFMKADLARVTSATSYHVNRFDWELQGVKATVSGATVTPAFLESAKTRPLLGRGILPEDFKGGPAQIVVISYRFWQEQWHGNPSVIGQTAKLNGRMVTIVGVMPQSFAMPENVEFWVAAQQERIVHVDLAYRSPGNGPAPDFSPYGTQVELSDLPAGALLPDGAGRPAKTGTVHVGPNQKSWIKILASADSAHPRDLCRLYIDRNRNGDFTDDGPPLTAHLTLNEKTKAWWSSFSGAEVSIPYGAGIVEPYMVNFWAVREGEEVPGIIRYSVSSWRGGTITVDSIDALVAVMDSDNDAVFSAKDEWSILGASEKDAPKRVLSYKEARHANRFMFLGKADGSELVLEFRSLSPDGRSLSFAIVDRAVRKAEDRAPDDTLAAERARPRASQPFPWIEGDFERAMAEAKQSGRKLLVDFWTSWCGPCQSMDQWIWTDAEVATLLNAGYVGVKLDGDLEKDLVDRFRVQGYPTILVLNSSGTEIQRFGYLSSKEMLGILKR